MHVLVMGKIMAMVRLLPNLLPTPKPLYVARNEKTLVNQRLTRVYLLAEWTGHSREKF